MSPDARIAQVAAKQQGAFTKDQARTAGFTDREIQRRRESRRWTTLHAGVYAIAGARATWEQRVIAATLHIGGVASHVTAAQIHGLIERSDAPVHVTLPPGQKRRKRKGIALHEAHLNKADVRRIENVPATTPNRTLCDLAGVVSFKVLESAVDDALQLGLTTIPKLARYTVANRLEHKRGMKSLRRLLADRAEGVMHKELERMFRRKLETSGLPKPVRQLAVGPYHIDFAYPRQKIGIELHGLGGHFSAAHFRRDKGRENTIVLAGYNLFHFTWDDVDLDWVRTEKTIREALDGAG